MAKIQNKKSRFCILNIRILDFGFRVFEEKRGFGLTEIVVAVAVATMTLVGFLQVGVTALRLLKAEKENLEATLLAREGLDAARAVRDESWAANIAPHSEGDAHYVAIENGKWKILDTPSPPIGQYSRTIFFDEVFRDAQDRISVVGVLDPKTIKATVRVGWDGKEVSLQTYLTDFQSYLTLPSDAVAVSYTGATTDGAISGFSFPSANAGDGDPAQSFTLGATASVSRVGLYLRRATAVPSDVYAELRATPTGVVLGTSQIISGASILSTGPAWVDFWFNPAVSLAAGTYDIRLRSVPDSTVAGSGSAGSIYWQYTLQNPSGPYSGGVARKGVGRLGSSGDAGTQLDAYDFGFKIYGLQ